MTDKAVQPPSLSETVLNVAAETGNNYRRITKPLNAVVEQSGRIIDRAWDIVLAGVSIGLTFAMFVVVFSISANEPLIRGLSILTAAFVLYQALEHVIEDDAWVFIGVVTIFLSAATMSAAIATNPPQEFLWAVAVACIIALVFNLLLVIVFVWLPFKLLVRPVVNKIIRTFEPTNGEHARSEAHRAIAHACLNEAGVTVERDGFAKWYWVKDAERHGPYFFRGLARKAAFERLNLAQVYIEKLTNALKTAGITIGKQGYMWRFSQNGQRYGVFFSERSAALAAYAGLSDNNRIRISS